jgi:hypothetical protein
MAELKPFTAHIIAELLNAAGVPKGLEDLLAGATRLTFPQRAQAAAWRGFMDVELANRCSIHYSSRLSQISSPRVR